MRKKGAKKAGRALETPDPELLDRELSWLDFDARVLALAEDPATPLLERVKFLAIFSANLDEFFMVRVAGLAGRVAAGLGAAAPRRLGPAHELKAIPARAPADAKPPSSTSGTRKFQHSRART